MRQKKPFGEGGFSEEQKDSRFSEEASGGGQAEEGRDAFWDPEEGERDPISLICWGIAREPFSP